MTDHDDSTQPVDDDATQMWSPEDDDADVADDVGETRAMPSSDTTRRMDVPPPVDPPPTRRITPAAPPPAAGPPTQQIAPIYPERNLAGGLIAAIVVIALLIGAVVGWTQHAPADHGVVARALVGPEGGRLVFDGSGVLTIPANDLPTATAVTIRKEKSDHRVRIGAEGEAGTQVFEPGELTVYVFEPTTQHFSQPVTIRLPRSQDAQAVFVDTKDAPRIIPGAPKGAVIEIRTTSFRFEDGTTS